MPAAGSCAARFVNPLVATKAAPSPSAGTSALTDDASWRSRAAEHAAWSSTNARRPSSGVADARPYEAGSTGVATDPQGHVGPPAIAVALTVRKRLKAVSARSTRARSPRMDRLVRITVTVRRLSR